jgi:hypothetical protein
LDGRNAGRTEAGKLTDCFVKSATAGDRSRHFLAQLRGQSASKPLGSLVNELIVTISDRYPLDGASEANHALEGRRTIGKIVLMP